MWDVIRVAEPRYAEEKLGVSIDNEQPEEDLIERLLNESKAFARVVLDGLGGD